MCWIGDIGFWILVLVVANEFWLCSSNWILVLGTSLKKTSTYQHSSLYNRTGMCQFLLFLHTVSHFLMRFLKNCGGILYFPSWLYNRVVYLQYFLLQLHNCACKPYTTAIKYVFSTSKTKTQLKTKWYVCFCSPF